MIPYFHLKHVFLKLGGTGFQGISRAGQTVLARLMESQIWLRLQALWLWSLFSLGESCSPAPALIPDTSVPPCMPLVPFRLLPQCWSSKGVSLSKFVCGFFKRNCLGIQKFLPATQSPLVFVARSCGDLSSWHWNPGLGCLVWSWDSLLLRYPSWIFIHHKWEWNQPILCLRPSDQCGWMWFL